MSYVEVSDEDYLRVLFPRRGVGRERLVEAAICIGLVIAREELVMDEPDGPPGAREVSTRPGLGLGEVRAFVCLRCRWVSWQEPDQHTCLGPGERQEADVLGFGGPMVVDLGLTSRLAPDDRAYEVALYPPTVCRAWGRFMRRTSGARIARRLWEQRQALVAARRAAGADVAAQHVGVVLDAVPEVARAACLSCTWIGTEVTSMSDPGWRDRALAIARRHEEASNG